MANVDTRNGFQPSLSSGRQIRRRIRDVFVATNNASALAPGDCYTIASDGSVSKATGATDTVNGVVEAIVLQGINEGPTSYESLPAATKGQVIGIEDPTCEFEVTAMSVLVQADYDTGARVTLVDGVTDLTLNISRQAIGAISGSGPFALIQPLARVNNDPYATFARVLVSIFNVVQ